MPVETPPVSLNTPQLTGGQSAATGIAPARGGPLGHTGQPAAVTNLAHLPRAARAGVAGLAISVLGAAAKAVATRSHPLVPLRPAFTFRQVLARSPFAQWRRDFSGSARLDWRAHSKMPPYPARCDLQNFFGVQRTDPATNADLRTEGRAMPDVTPQTLGRYISKVIGQWGQKTERSKLPNMIVKNLVLLSKTEGDDARQLHLENTLHWHCMREDEKAKVLESLGTKYVELLGDISRDPSQEGQTAVMGWLEHTLCFTPRDELARLLQACSPQAQKALANPVTAPDHEAVIKARNSDIRMEMPLDHLYDFAGFMEATQRVYGQLPAEKQGLKVCIVGGGPSGIIAADGCNRIGAVPTVLEQAPAIGGRARSLAGIGRDREHPGAMRAATSRGNCYHALAMHFGLETGQFPNPEKVNVSYMLGNEVLESKGGVPQDEQMLKIRDDYYKAMIKPVLEPIARARDACDTALFRELIGEFLDKFDPQSQRAAITSQLKEHGIEWTERDWALFDIKGFEVGGAAGYNTTGSLSELRFAADERLKDHVFYPDGFDAPLHALIKSHEPLPDGTTPPSLEEQGAIRTNTEVLPDGIKKIDGKYHVTSRNKLTNETTTDVYDELIFAAGPAEAIRLGLTSPQEHEPLMSNELAQAMEAVRLVSATKMSVSIPKDVLEGLELPEGIELPGNIQSTKPFQQMYMVEGRDSYILYGAYAQGDNAAKVASMSGPEQFSLYIKMLKDAANEKPGDPKYEKLKAFGEALELGKDRVNFMDWGREKHFGGAFKMDAAFQLANTRALWDSLLATPTGAIFINEKLTFEEGFASGGVAAGILGVQQLIDKNGGDLPKNSPFHQERPY